MNALAPMANRLPTGPGSRGGRWHIPEHRKAYYRAWRAAHPEYREREQLRRARARSSNPADIVVAPHFPRPFPEALQPCECPCGCHLELVICGLCSAGLHE